MPLDFCSLSSLSTFSSLLLSPLFSLQRKWSQRDTNRTPNRISEAISRLSRQSDRRHPFDERLSRPRNLHRILKAANSFVCGYLLHRNRHLPSRQPAGAPWRHQGSVRLGQPNRRARIMREKCGVKKVVHLQNGCFKEHHHARSLECSTSKDTACQRRTLRRPA